MTTYAILNDAFFAIRPRWMPAKLYQAVHSRANPRPQQYMLNLLAQEFPGVHVVSSKAIPADAKTIVLLYSDSIGLGYSYIEGTLIREVKLIALNGRKRKFELSRSKHLTFCCKRFLELTLLPELLFAPFLIVGATLLAVKDQLIGFEHDK